MIKLHCGFLPAEKIKYENQPILSVKGIREEKGISYYCLEHDVWVKEIGKDKYVTDWTNEEVWARAEEVECNDVGEVISSQAIGFALMQVDRKKGIIFDLKFRDTNLTENLKG